MTELSKKEAWLDSKAACKELHVSDCDLSHIRESGKVRFAKIKNAYLYMNKDLQKLKGEREK